MLFNQIKKWIPIVAIGCFFMFYIVYWKDSDNREETKEIEPVSFPDAHIEEKSVPSSTKNIEKKMVDVKGEVTSPGIYELEDDARVYDAIEMAGGYKENADQTAINLAQRIQDEMVIYVPEEGEEASGEMVADNAKEQIKINTATEEEVESLTGIGPSKAQAIIRFREENGLFQKIEDLLEVPGIGEKTLENFKDDIRVP